MIIDGELLIYSIVMRWVVSLVQSHEEVSHLMQIFTRLGVSFVCEELMIPFYIVCLHGEGNPINVGKLSKRASYSNYCPIKSSLRCSIIESEPKEVYVLH